MNWSLMQPLAKKRLLELNGNAQACGLGVGGDIEKIYGILDALLSNAIKYTETGSVTLTLD